MRSLHVSKVLFYDVVGDIQDTHFFGSYLAKQQSSINNQTFYSVNTASEDAESNSLNIDIPPQFRYEEYKQLDNYLTQRFGLPFTYKRFNESSYHYIPYGRNYVYKAQPTNFCSNDTFMVVMIMSTVKKPEERKVLRDTWFKDKVVLGQKIKYLFIVASSPDEEVNIEIKNEALKYNDILYMDHLDSYNNITMSIMNTFNWLHRNCHSIRYILKGDPDSYFNMPKIVQWLLDLPPDRQTRLYHGSCFITSFFIRKPGFKWHTPYIVDNNDLTWPYCVGVGYVISADLLAPLVLASRHYPYMLRTEDMSIGLAALMLNVTPYRYHDYYWTPPEHAHYRNIPKCHWGRYFGFHKVPLTDISMLMEVFEGHPNCNCFCLFLRLFLIMKSCFSYFIVALGGMVLSLFTGFCLFNYSL